MIRRNADFDEREPEFLPVWSVDGKSIYHTLHRETGTEIWQHSVNGSLRKKIWGERGPVGWPRVSQTGTFLVYQQGRPLIFGAGTLRRERIVNSHLTAKEQASHPYPLGEWYRL